LKAFELVEDWTEGSTLGEPYPLFHNEADLNEAQLLDMRVRVIRSQVWFLIDSRGFNKSLGSGNTVLILVDGVRSLDWKTSLQFKRGYTAQMIYTLATTPSKDRDDASVHMELRTTFAVCAVVGRSVTGFVCNVGGLPDAHPDYGATPTIEVERAFQHWDSEVEPLSVSSVVAE
jgi:hypothetical protein